MKSRLPAGYGGGGQNMNAMIKQAQKMQEKMAEAQAAIDEMEFTTSAGGGVVSITMSGKKQVKNITINPEIVDPDDVEMLEDVVTAAVNEAIANVEKVTEEEMAKYTGGLPNMPGLM